MNSTRLILRGFVVATTVVVITLFLGIAFLLQHHRSERASPQVAEAEFQRLRARFAGQRPLVDMRERHAQMNNSTAPAGSPLHSLHTVIFDTRGGQRLVRIAVPYDFARLFARRTGFHWLGELTYLDDTEFDPEPIQLALDQVERHGPGLIVDYRHSNGGQFIAWAE